MALTPGTRVGAFEILGILGRGGMGEVYRAQDTALGREVAIKILPEVFAADPDRSARFALEARVLASLNHPNVGAIYGLEEKDGVRALVLELVEGPTLADRIVDAGASSTKRPGCRSTKSSRSPSRSPRRSKRRTSRESSTAI